MRLYEYEAKELLKKHGIAVPESQLLSSAEPPKFTVVKAQILAGGRGKAGGVKVCSTPGEAAQAIQEMLHSTILKEKVDKILVEEKVDSNSLHYIAFTYDTDTGGPVLLYSDQGGVEIENKNITKIPLDPGCGIYTTDDNKVPFDTWPLYQVFAEQDCRLLEINPLAIVNNKPIALDAVIDLDDDAFYKHEGRTYPPRTPGAGTMSEREQKVKTINDADHRGTIKYMELDGDIGFLAAGGGGSITCMDALLAAGGKPANYTEYSGNPPTEKVYELTKVILSKPLKGLWIVGAIANFTKVDATMQGVVQALEEIKPDFPIVVRRSGPNEKEGIQLLEEAAEQHNLNLQVFGKETPMTQTAKIITEKAYGNSN